jgi:hypothetical protein
MCSTPAAPAPLWAVPRALLRLARPASRWHFPAAPRRPAAARAATRAAGIATSCSLVQHPSRL